MERHLPERFCATVNASARFSFSRFPNNFKIIILFRELNINWWDIHIFPEVIHPVI